ncbi:hypothetical protein LIER_38914 [Lithospermum erythrorhizon]|uniref:Integrase catalytic domain-containing protein n=1 Tax=Lithospermum erythrorhizon TaxID=34254 RepID=A0AAV3Q942_LITER
MKEIFTSFGVAQVLVTDNGTQFAVEKIEHLSAEVDIDHRTALVSYPQVKGQVELMNRADTSRVTNYDELANEHGLRLNLDLLEEK